MSGHDRIRRAQILRQAEGYLELDMPHHALGVLDRLSGRAARHSHVYYLRGEALRALDRFSDALSPLRQAAELAPGNIHIWLAQGWCYKRIGQLPKAIRALEEALEADESEAIIHYNLACYWALARNKRRALSYLARAFDLDPSYRDLVEEEPDFDPLRKDADFLALTSIIV